MQSLELLFLPENTTSEDAVRYIGTEKVLGVAVKSPTRNPRYALRFATAAKAQTFANANNMSQVSQLPRWKLSGVTPFAGEAGVWQLLESRGWQIYEILYLKGHQCHFIAQTTGNLASMRLQNGDVTSQMRFTALNAAARQLAREYRKDRRGAADASASSAKAKAPMPTARQTAQARWMAAISRNRAPSSSGIRHPRRPATGRTGETPPPAKAKASIPAAAKAGAPIWPQQALRDASCPYFDMAVSDESDEVMGGDWTPTAAETEANLWIQRMAEARRDIANAGTEEATNVARARLAEIRDAAEAAGYPQPVE